MPEMCPVVIGGVLPAQDHGALRRLGVARVFTPSDYKLTDVVSALVDLCTGTRGPARSQRRRPTRRSVRATRACRRRTARAIVTSLAPVYVSDIANAA